MYLANLSHTVGLQTSFGHLLQQRSGNGCHKVEVVLVIELCPAVLADPGHVGLSWHQEIDCHCVWYLLPCCLDLPVGVCVCVCVWREGEAVSKRMRERECVCVLRERCHSQVQGDSHVPQLSHGEQRRDDVRPKLVVDQNLPDWLRGGHRATRQWLVEIQHPLQSRCRGKGRGEIGGEGGRRGERGGRGGRGGREREREDWR